MERGAFGDVEVITVPKFLPPVADIELSELISCLLRDASTTPIGLCCGL